MILFPKPDRSTFRPRLTLTDEIYELDIGWAEGEFKDGRPYRAELWSWTHLLVVTFFFSTIDLETFSEQKLADLLQKEFLLKFKGDQKVYPSKVRDSSENEMLSITVLVRHGDETLLTLGPRFNPYQEITAPEEKNKSLIPLAVRPRLLIL